MRDVTARNQAKLSLRLNAVVTRCSYSEGFLFFKLKDLTDSRKFGDERFDNILYFALVEIKDPIVYTE